MIKKNEALQTIESINMVITENLTTNIRNDEMLVIGFYVMTVPFLELFFQNYVDPSFNIGSLTNPIMFILRTLFYWGIALGISKLFKPKKALHPVIAMAFSFDRFIPGICVATAVILASAGYSNLIWPILSLFIGLDFLLIGIFCKLPFKIFGWGYVFVGLLGIYISNWKIHNLWMYAVFFQGLAIFFAALVMHMLQKKQSLQK